MTEATERPDGYMKRNASERHHELAMAAVQRAPQAPEHTVSLTLNAKGDVQIEVTGRGTNLEALSNSVRREFDVLCEMYPRNGGQS